MITLRYIVVGTISSMGEEVSSRGKIIIFDVMDVSSSFISEFSCQTLEVLYPVYTIFSKPSVFMFCSLHILSSGCAGPRETSLRLQVQMSVRQRTKGPCHPN